jgi:2-methylcitrate dehydratase PrpD
MHLGFCIGMKLIDGEVFVDQMVEENVARPDLIEFSKRVNVVRDEERERKGRPFARGTDVEIVLKDGTTLKKTLDHFLGSYQRPMTDEQMASKFRRLASRALSPDSVTELEQTVRDLEHAPTTVGLVSLLAGTR